MLTFTLIVASAGLLAAVTALLQLKRVRARAERLAESYWELRYEVTQVKIRLDRLEHPANPDEGGPDAEAAAPRPASPTSFVPLSSLKK